MTKSKNSIFYHGTCADHLESILKNGIQPVPGTQRIWNDSYPDHVYLWSSKGVCEANCQDEYDENAGYSEAVDSASFTLLKAKDKRIVVFKVKLSEADVLPDVSGQGMDTSGSVCCDMVPKTSIIEYTISEDLSLLVPFIAQVYYSMNSAKYSPTKLEKEIISKIPEDSGIYIGDLWIDWTTVPVKKIQQLSPA